jgi:GTPase SAR1 family protein
MTDERSHPDDFATHSSPLDDPDEAENFFHTVCDQADDEDIEPGEEQYWTWITGGPLFVPDLLESILDCSEKSDCVRLSALFSDITHHYNKFSEEYKEKVENYDEEFSDDSLYHYCRFLVYSKSNLPEHREEALISGMTAIEGIEESPRLYRQVATVGTELVDQTSQLSFEYQGESIGEDTILSQSAKYANKATILDPNSTASYRVLASVLGLQQKFDEALEVLYEGRNRCISQGRETDTFENEIDEMQKEKRSYELERSIETASERLDNISSDLTRVENDLNKTTDQYRSEIFRFIGFFAAVITFALASVQLALNLSFPQSGGIILMFIGGLILAFGELDVLLIDSISGSAEDEGRNAKSMLIGIVLIAVGILIGFFPNFCLI